ncbi:MAG: RAMP superfamily CRISPR-associated protein [Verrucomicrobiota bacterium]
MKEPYHPGKFENRWLLEGTLTTVTPFHLGSGHVIPRKGLTEPLSQEVSVKAVFRDVAGLPCIPGSSLKGVLRARLVGALGEQDDAVLNLFGKPEVEGRKSPIQTGHAGRAEFHESRAPEQTLPASQMPPPFWKQWPDAMLTGLNANVAIRRRTRTAAHQKLFHTEFVPPGIQFKVRITAQNLDGPHMASLLWALEQFDDPNRPLHLGADGGNDWGRFHWAVSPIRKMTKKDMAQWLNPTPANTGLAQGLRAALPAVGYKALESLLPFALASSLPVAASNGSDSITLRLKLRFDGPFLVKRPAPPKARGGTAPNAEPYLDAFGRVVLPASAFRGVFRAQVERILRTLAPDETTALAWAPDPTEKAIEDTSSQGISALSPIAKVFGATGWKSPVELSDFTCAKASPPPVFNHELVAIDRFTGGAAEGAKFKFRVAWCPVFTGTITLRRDRWRAVGVDDWACGLCALALRDLREGDLVFGLGSGKGYGACAKAEFDWFPDAAKLAKHFQECVRKNSL